NVRKYDHITPSLEAIGWLKLDKKRNLHSLLCRFEILNSSIPSYLSSRFTYLSSHHNLNTRSRHETILTIPSHRTSSYSSSFTIALPRLRYLLASGTVEIKFNSNANGLLSASNVRKYDHITPSLEAIGWLKVDKKRNLHSLLFLFEILNSSIPSYLSSRFTYLSSHHNLNTRSRHETILTIPSHRTSSYSSSFTIALPRLWNSLPAGIRDCRNKTEFKRKLTRYLVSN
ncbi:hypothetical protein ANN_17925, partial [Periplaneta americana]